MKLTILNLIYNIEVSTTIKHIPNSHTGIFTIEFYTSN